MAKKMADAAANPADDEAMVEVHDIGAEEVVQNINNNNNDEVVNQLWLDIEDDDDDFDDDHVVDVEFINELEAAANVAAAAGVHPGVNEDDHDHEENMQQLLQMIPWHLPPSLMNKKENAADKKVKRNPKTLFRQSLNLYFKTVDDLRNLDSLFEKEIPVTLFQEMLDCALNEVSRNALVNIILKHWPHKVLKAVDFGKNGHRFAPSKSGSQNPVKALIKAFLSAFGNVVERKHLRILDLRGLKMVEKLALEECRGFHVDPYFRRNSDYCIILPIRYRRSSLAGSGWGDLDMDMGHSFSTDWLKILQKGPGFFQPSSMCMDVTPHEDMKILDYCSKEYFEQFIVGKYCLFTDPTQQNNEGNNNPQQQQQQQQQQPEQINDEHFFAHGFENVPNFGLLQQQISNQALKISMKMLKDKRWLTKMASFSNLNTLTLSSLPSTSPSKRVMDRSACEPCVEALEDWNKVLSKLTKLKQLTVSYQTLKGHLETLLSETHEVFKLEQFSLEGSVLDDCDLAFLADYLPSNKDSISIVNLGIYNFKHKLDSISGMIKKMGKLTQLGLYMSGKADDRALRRLTQSGVMGLAEKFIGTDVEMRDSIEVLELPEMNLDSPGLGVAVIDTILPKCKK